MPILPIRPRWVIPLQKSVFEHVHPDDLETIRQLERSITGQQPVHGSLQFRHLHADGHAVRIMDAVYAPSGAMQNVVFILRDLTDRQRLQEIQIEREILRHSLEKEQDLSALKSHMMTRIAHEFRTPLAIILSSIETLEIYAARLKPEQRMAKRRIISQQIQHLTDMLDDIGMVIRGSFVSEKLQKSRICLQEIIEDVIGKLGKNDYPQERFELNLHEGLIIHGDYGNLKRAFYEIISNAARFSEHNTPIQIQATASDEQVRLQVSDQGIGIHSDDVAHAFEPFFRGRNIDEIGGLGLGLTIAQAVIQAHQGTIELESQLGTGTRITVTIPA